MRGIPKRYLPGKEIHCSEPEMDENVDMQSIVQDRELKV